MSERRSISFDEEERELLNYFDSNGRSKIAKTAMSFYKEHKGKIFIDSIKDIIQILNVSQKPQINDQKIQKLIK